MEIIVDYIFVPFIFIIILFITVFSLVPYFRSHKKILLILSALLVVLLYIFGGLTTSQWGIFSAILAIGSIIFTDDLLRKLLGIESSLRVSSILIRGRIIITLLAPILLASVMIIKPEDVERNILPNSKFIVKYNPSLTRIYNNGTEIKTINYKSSDDTQYISKFIENQLLIQTILDPKLEKARSERIFSLGQLDIKYRGKTYKLVDVFTDNSTNNYYLTLSNRKSVFDDYFIRFMVSIYRCVVIEVISVVFLVIYYFCFFNLPRKSNIMKFLAGEDSAWDIQGQWFLLEEYKFDNSKFLYSASSFYILGNLFHIEKEVFKIVGCHNFKFIEYKGKKYFINQIDDQTIKINGYTFVHSFSELKKSIFVRYTVPKNRRGEKLYFKENSKKEFLGFYLNNKESILCWDTKKNILTKTRLKNQNSYYLDGKYAIPESLDNDSLYDVNMERRDCFEYEYSFKKSEFIINGVKYIKLDEY